jgi:Mg-chelatase subunit ChlD
MVWPPAGEPDVLAENPVAANYYVVLDGSGSMEERACEGSGTKISQARKALADFAGSVPADANLGLAAFGVFGVREFLPLAVGNMDRFISTVNSIEPGGGTPLSSAVQLGREQLETQARRQLGYGEYHLVIVTDGEANSGYDPTYEVDDLLAGTPIVLHTIGFCIGTNHSLNQPGRTLYVSANNPEELSGGLQEVLAEAPDFNVTEFKD